MSSSTSSATASASTSAAASVQVGSNLKVVGIVLAITSGVLIGSSFVFKKKGLLRSQAGQAAGEGVAYLKSPLWWLGMIMMILGELCNFAAYAFVEALIVTPMGALSVVVCAILSSWFLKESLSFFGWLGCALCILGSIIIALNGPQENSVGQITEFQKLFLAPGFLAFGSALIAASLVIIFYFAPKYGGKSMLWYISVCSMIGGISVSVTTGLGAAIVTTAFGDNQFKHWFMYFLMVFVAVTLITEVYYLNKALAIFNTAMVTPTYYVIFTFCSMVSSVILFQGLKASAAQIITIVMAFITICIGITILQMSKVDPKEFNKLDRRSTMLLDAARARTESMDEKSLTAIEDPGIDALRGSFGTIGSVIRAKSARRMSMSSQGSARSPRHPPPVPPRHRDVERDASFVDPSSEFRGGFKRHQLYDHPVPRFSASTHDFVGEDHRSSTATDRRPTIKWDDQDMIHQYHPTASGDNRATHEQRHARGGFDSQTSLFSAPNQSQSDLTLLGARRTTSPERQMPSFLPTVRRSVDSDQEPFTAPAASPYYRPRATDPFDKQPSTANPTFSSFPSLSNSEPSSSSNSPLDEERGGPGRDYPRTSNASKHYPKGDKDSDREESIGLWRRSSSSDFNPPDHGGIRLVTNTLHGSHKH